MSWDFNFFFFQKHGCCAKPFKNILKLYFFDNKNLINKRWGGQKQINYSTSQQSSNVIRIYIGFYDKYVILKRQANKNKKAKKKVNGKGCLCWRWLHIGWHFGIRKCSNRITEPKISYKHKRFGWQE